MFVHLERIRTNATKMYKMCENLSLPASKIIIKQLANIDNELESTVADIGYLVLVEIDAQIGIEYKEDK